jgi:hypothetical protein
MILSWREKLRMGDSSLLCQANGIEASYAGEKFRWGFLLATNVQSSRVTKMQRRLFTCGPEFDGGIRGSRGHYSFLCILCLRLLLASEWTTVCALAVTIPDALDCTVQTKWGDSARK